MSVQDVAVKLVEMCRKGQFHEAITALYSADIASVEPMAMGGMPAETQGIQGVLGKGKWWVDNHEIHSMVTDGPFIHGDKFAVMFTMDVTNKPTGKRHKGTEIGVYTVSNGKVVREEFFYGVPDSNNKC